MGMNFVGVGSGVALNKMLTQLEAAERMRLTPITSQKKRIDDKISGFGKLKSTLSKLSEATSKLKQADSLQSRTVTGDGKYFNASATSEAALGNYTIKIDELAVCHSLASRAVTDTTAALCHDKAACRITIEQANGQKLAMTLDSNETSLASIASAINRGTIKDEKGNAQPSTLNAAVVRSSDNHYRLVITSKDTGEKNAITAISSSDSTLNGFLGFNDKAAAEESAMKEVAKAKDAKLTFNHIEITGASNVIKNIVSGVDITLHRITPLAKTFTVSTDNEKAKKTVQEWVEAFNELQSTTVSLTAWRKPAPGSDEKNNSHAPLMGDSTLREIDNSIRAIFSHAQAGKFSLLSQIGINMDEKGKLSIDDKQLDKALSNNGVDVSRLFSGTDDETGIANEICLAVKNYVGNGGTLDNITNSLSSTLKSLQNSYDRTERSIEHTLTRYRRQFVNLDRLMSSLNNTSHYLAAQCAAMIK